MVHYLNYRLQESKLINFSRTKHPNTSENKNFDFLFYSFAHPYIFSEQKQYFIWFGFGF